MDVFYVFLFLGLPVLWIGTLIWGGIVLTQKGHGLMLLWILVPFGFIVVAVLATQTIAKPGTVWFDRYEPGGPKAIESATTFPDVAAAKGYGSDGLRVDAVQPTRSPTGRAATQVVPPTQQERLSALKAIHTAGNITDDQYDALRRDIIDRPPS